MASDLENTEISIYEDLQLKIDFNREAKFFIKKPGIKSCWLLTCINYRCYDLTWADE